MVDFFMVNVGKYTSPMDAMGGKIKANKLLIRFEEKDVGGCNS